MMEILRKLFTRHISLKQKKDGLVPAAEAWYPFKLLLDADDELSDFVEFWPDPSDNAWLWAHDGYFIGCLLYKFGHVRCLLIADGFRREGHGNRIHGNVVRTR